MAALSIRGAFSPISPVESLSSTVAAVGKAPTPSPQSASAPVLSPASDAAAAGPDRKFSSSSSVSLAQRLDNEPSGTDGPEGGATDSVAADGTGSSSSHIGPGPDVYVPRPLNVRNSQIAMETRSSSSPPSEASGAGDAAEREDQTPSSSTTTFFTNPTASAVSAVPEESDDAAAAATTGASGGTATDHDDGAKDDGALDVDDDVHDEAEGRAASPLRPSGLTLSSPRPRTPPRSDSATAGQAGQARSASPASSDDLDEVSTPEHTPTARSQWGVITPVPEPETSVPRALNLASAAAGTGSGSGSGSVRRTHGSALQLQQQQSRSLTPTATPAATPAATPTWNDASLRSFLDDSDHVRNLFVIVHDKSSVVPAGPDHPVTGHLFKEESRALEDMSNRLDDLLTTWLSRRGIMG
ncbi:hypothetical protein KEM52_001910 [Ascosphaera acerosa]|nr:hypothetical protein KEM52_001910 [Ascosphaera acerosa]